MKINLITETNSDLAVVNAARVSFNKESMWDDSCLDKRKLHTSDVRLIKYLADRGHWTPFAHPQECFEFWMMPPELLYFTLNANLAGFEWPKNQGHHGFKMRGSLYAWLTNIRWLPRDVSGDISQYIYDKYPVSYKALIGDFILTSKTGHTNHIPNPIQEDELRSYTLRIHIPIFIKRQLETHRRGFVMTDIEDWSQNEVSRRYVDSEPEMYTPKVWRMQSGDKKQGSSGEVMTGLNESLVKINYYHQMHNSLMYYKSFNEYGMAHEESRIILPLSTYTTFWWTGSVKSWRRLLSLRDKPDVQSQTREAAQLVKEALPPLD